MIDIVVVRVQNNSVCDHFIQYTPDVIWRIPGGPFKINHDCLWPC